MSEVLIAVDEPLDEGEAESLTSRLREIRGVTQASSSRRARRMILCRYEGRKISAKVLLAAIAARGHRARLIGL